MSTRLLISVCLLFSITLAASQDSTGAKRHFSHQGMYNFNGMYTQFDNWVQGGKTNFNTSVLLREQIKIEGVKRTGRHLIQLNYGTNYQDGRWDKTIDKLQYNVNFSKGGADDTRWVRLSSQLEFNTQAMPGYLPNDSLKTKIISDFGAPLYTQLSLGLVSNKFENWSFFFSPLGSKTTIVLDSAIRAEGQYGLDTANFSLVEGGANATLSFNNTYWKSFRIIVRSDFFYGYFDETPSVDVRGELIAYYRLGKMLTLNGGFQFIRDIDASPDWQFRSNIGLGITLNHVKR